MTLARGCLDHEVRSICVHGDTASAAMLAARVRDALVADGIELRAFA
jgi:lactam utilization protein B